MMKFKNCSHAGNVNFNFLSIQINLFLKFLVTPWQYIMNFFKHLRGEHEHCLSSSCKYKGVQDEHTQDFVEEVKALEKLFGKHLKK